MNHLAMDDLAYRAWQEACRVTEIETYASSLADLLAEALPLWAVAIYEFEPQSRSLIRLCTIRPGRTAEAPLTRARCNPTQVQRLLEWIKLGELATEATESPAWSVLGEVLPAFGADMLVGGLASPRNVYGLLVLELRKGHELQEFTRAMVAKLLEPFAVALENTQRLRSLGKQAKTAEADKAGLLARLGRDEIVDEVVGVEGGLREVYRRIERVCESDLPILILGETGSAKEVLAREIHQRSSRADAPFIRVNCGAIAPELIDSELFGHEKGSFTGATAQRRGWFERANGGSLFLDEVGELPLAAQVRLLRVLQDGVIQRVGGEDEFQVDVRVIAATHRDLHVMIADGRFREDLWYRLASFPVQLPPLRERREDIPALARHFARRAARRFGQRLCLPDPEALRQLSDYSWPGNVRELAAVIDRAVILGNGEELAVVHALGGGRPTETTAISSVAPTVSGTQLLPASRSAFLTLDAAMRHHIEQVLAHTKGRIDGPHGAARMLAINPHTLRARMRKLDVSWNAFRRNEDSK